MLLWLDWLVCLQLCLRLRLHWLSLELLEILLDRLGSADFSIESGSLLLKLTVFHGLFRKNGHYLFLWYGRSRRKYHLLLWQTWNQVLRVIHCPHACRLLCAVRDLRGSLLLLLLFAYHLAANVTVADILAVDRVLFDELLSDLFREISQIRIIEWIVVLHLSQNLLEELAAKDHQIITSEEVSAIIHS